MTRTFSIATAIFYATGKLHIGHCYEAVFADALARYHRQKGAQVHFLTGTDEHGLKIQRKAADVGLPPQAWVDGFAGSVRELAGALGISHDDFIRTTEERHRRVVQQIFTRLFEQGDIYLDRYEGWYCQQDEAFVPAARALEGNLCPECGRPLEWTQESTYKFRLSKYAAQILALLERPGFVVPETRRNEMLSFVRQGLEDLAVTRTSVSWGIPVPFDPAHTIYVWIDALSNYISALGYGTPDDGRYRTFWPADLHVVGKDIARFHAVVWPALLLALEAPLPKQIYAHGWLNINGVKQSKSLGNVVDPWPLLERYGVDGVRYYLLREIPFGQDANWSEEALVLRYNVDLANDLGNLLSRTTMMLGKFRRGIVPEPAQTDGVLEGAAREAAAAVDRHLEQLRPGEALGAILGLVGRANKYIEEQSPWSLVKVPGQEQRLDGVLYSLLETLRIAAVLLVPFLVETPGKIYEQLGLAPGAVQTGSPVWGGLPAGTEIRRGAPLFPRIQA